MTSVRRWRRVVGALGLAAVAFAVAAGPAAAADPIRDGQWYLTALGITAAQTKATGAGVRVAVIDSGVDGSVPDLRGAVVAGKDFSGEGSPNGQKPVGVAGDEHGTGVASVLAGRGHKSAQTMGVLGSAPGAQLLSASVDVGAATGQAQIAAAINWAVVNQASVINLSIETSVTSRLTAAVANAEAHDVVIVIAAANDNGVPPAGLATLPGLVVVAGVDRDLKIDPQSSDGRGVTIAAPYSTLAQPKFKPIVPSRGIPVALPASADKQYAGEAGTSLATPIVAGVVAMIRQQHRNWSAANVINQVIRSATPTGGGSVPNDTYGYGVLNAEAAVTKSFPSVTKNPLGSAASPSGSATPSSASSGSGSASSSAPTSGAPASSAPGSSSAPSAVSSGSGSSVGLIIGIVAGVIVLAGLVFWLVRRGGSDDGRRGGGGGVGPPSGPGGPPPAGSGWSPPNPATGPPPGWSPPNAGWQPSRQPGPPGPPPGSDWQPS